MIADVRQLLIDARETLDAAGVAYAVIGGCARNAYAEPRATKDVDFVAAADPTSYCPPNVPGRFGPTRPRNVTRPWLSAEHLRAQA